MRLNKTNEYDIIKIQKDLQILFKSIVNQCFLTKVSIQNLVSMSSYSQPIIRN